MWDCTRQLLQSGRAERYVPRWNGSPLPYREVLRLWQDDPAFRDFFISTLRDSKFSAYRWETPPVTTAAADRPFEFVLLDTPGLARAPDERAFAEQFRTAGTDEQVIAFPNRGGDAVLVVPRPAGPAAAYVHLAAFVRKAPAAQVHELWRVAGATLSRHLGAKPTWLSTAGMGVSWLHVRLDSQPKYYGFATYREA